MNYRNILFIGLGGHSGRIVRLIKELLSPFQKQNNLHYLLLDLERLHTLGYDNISEEEFLFFGGKNPREYVEEVLAGGEHSEELCSLDTYFPVRESWFRKSLPNRSVERGAGRKRMVGRLMLYANREEVALRIRKLLYDLESKHDMSNPIVVVVSSCCGGTGSSIFYDILSKFAVPSVDLFPVVIGPSMLVAANSGISTELADKVKMNAMAFFEELNFYMKFPDACFSFYSNRSSVFDLRRILFFDNELSDTATIAGHNVQAFEKYVAQCLALMFTGAYRDGGTQDIWANIENISDDMLNQPHSVLSNATDELVETSPFISPGFICNPCESRYMANMMEYLFGAETLPDEEPLSETDIVTLLRGGKSSDKDPFNLLLTEINADSDSFFKKYVQPFVTDASMRETFHNSAGKLLLPGSVNRYLGRLQQSVSQATVLGTDWAGADGPDDATGANESAESRADRTLYYLKKVRRWFGKKKNE